MLKQPIGAACALALVCGLTAQVQAQPNPFRAYEEQPPPPPTTDDGATTAEPTDTSGGWRRSKDAAFTKGTWTAGGSMLLNATTTSNTLPSGSERTNTNVFVKLSPSLGYFVLDRLEISGSIGWLSRELDRGRTTDTATENSVLFEGTARYFLPINPRIALMGEGSLGGYLGSSNRIIAVQQGESSLEVNEETSTYGFALGLGLGASYQPAKSLQLRAGLNMISLLGSETIESVNEPLDVTTVNLGLNLGAVYLF